MATPPPGKSNTSNSSHLAVLALRISSSGLPLPGTTKWRSRLYWSPKAWRPMMIGWVQLGIRRGHVVGKGSARGRRHRPGCCGWCRSASFHIFFRLNSFTRASSGRDRRAFDADAVRLDRVGGVEGHLVVGGVAVLDAEVVVLQVDVEVGVDQLVADVVPDDPGHLVAVELDDRVRDLDPVHARCLLLGDVPLGDVPLGDMPVCDVPIAIRAGGVRAIRPRITGGACVPARRPDVAWTMPHLLFWPITSAHDRSRVAPSMAGLP